MTNTYCTCQLCHGRGWLRVRPRRKRRGGTQPCWACIGTGRVYDFESRRRLITQLFLDGDPFVPAYEAKKIFPYLTQEEADQLIAWADWLHSIGRKRARELYGRG